MTEVEYETRNKLGYEGDSFIGLEIGKLVKQFNINLIFETGAYIGSTTNKLAEHAKVISVELKEDLFWKAKEAIKDNPKIQLYLGDSVKVLDMLLPFVGYQNILFFLDAHFYDYCPLLDELKTIAKFNIKPVICIHDFQVPGRPDLGFDTYKGQPYTFEWIRPEIEAIYGNEYAYNYNSEAEGAKRGIVYVYPKK